MILRLADFLEREAGYELCSLALIAAGLILCDGPQRQQAADRLITFALGVLARSMGGTKRPVPPGTTTVTNTAQITETAKQE